MRCQSLVAHLVIMTLVVPCVAADIPAIELEKVGGWSGGFGWSMTCGWEFEVKEVVTITRLGVFDVDGKGLSQQTPVAIWDSTGLTVISVVVPPGNEAHLIGRFRFVAADPIQLQPGKRYVIGAFYTPESKEGVISSNGGVSLTSPAPIRWLRSRRGRSDELALPPATTYQSELLPGAFGPNFTIAEERSVTAAPKTYYTTRQVQPDVHEEVVVRTEMADGSHRDVTPITITLFATPNGKLTQLVLNGDALGTGEEAFQRLATTIRGPNARRDASRPLIRIAYTAGVRADDLRLAMETAYLGRFEPRSWPRTARGCDVLSLYEARVPQKANDGKYVDSDRFRDAGDYIEDRWTGLLWQKDGDESGPKNFYQAADYAKQLQLGGLTGWRVPTKDELVTIFPATFAPFKDTHY